MNELFDGMLRSVIKDFRKGFLNAERKKMGRYTDTVIFWCRQLQADFPKESNRKRKYLS